MLSSRSSAWAEIDYAHGKQNEYHPIANPNGAVNFGNAENWLLHEPLTEFINKNNEFDVQACAYGEGYTGTLRLRTAMGKFMTKHFNPVNKINAEEITFAAGVTDLNEVCALATCDEGEAIMLGAPVYGAFERDLTTRTGVHLEYVSMTDEEQFSVGCVPAFERGFEAAKRRGITVKALIICNPHNPLGRCYPRDTLIELLRFCSSKGIHLISDEIYALSVYQREDRPHEEFTSVRSSDYTGIIDQSQVHVLYGMSKDFGAAGLRLGCIVSQNRQLTNAVRAVCRFSSPSQFSMILAARFLEDEEFVMKFLQQSHVALRDSRLLTEKLLDDNGIPYSKSGNAGLFVWINLSEFLPTNETGGDGWEAERLLNKRLRQGGVVMSYGEAYHASEPGCFRVIHCMKEHVLKEGIKRILQVVHK